MKSIRRLSTQAINFGMVISSALMIWKLLICVSGSESPVVVVLSRSMTPGFKRGDLLFLHMNEAPIRTGEIVVFRVEGKEIPIVHRVLKVHAQRGSGGIKVLTKGDNNSLDDSYGVYAGGQQWLQRHHIIGKAAWFVPYAGWATIILTEKSAIKYLLIGTLGLLFIAAKD